jgi:hypothetical protein
MLIDATKPFVAVKTLAAIEEALERDQGQAFRALLEQYINTAKDAFDPNASGPRNHLGASLIGRDCGRELWYSFRWAKNVVHSGRLLRLFNRGHLEEARFVALLRMIHCEVWQHKEDGKQFRVRGLDQHFGGSLDAVVRGVPDMPDVAMLGEFKTHGEKSFEKLKEEGVRNTKYEHYVQMQVYSGSNDLSHALYLAVNKNTDELYAEIVQFDAEQYRMFIDRALRIIYALEPPQKINPSPGWYKCKMCDFLQVCHFSETKAVNCRTCKFAQPVEEGRWRCHHWNADLTDENQRDGCPSYSAL